MSVERLGQLVRAEEAAQVLGKLVPKGGPTILPLSRSET